MLLILLVFLIILSSKFIKFQSVQSCNEEKILDTYIQQANGEASYTYTCPTRFNQGCRYEIFDCKIPRMWSVFKSPAPSGNFNAGQTITFFCGDGSIPYYGQMGLRIWGKYCTENLRYTANIIANDFYTTKDDISFQVSTNAPSGHLIFAKLNGVEKFSNVVDGKAEFNFGKLNKGKYTLEVYANNIDMITRSITVLGKMNVYFTAGSYKQNAGNVYACLHIEDENGRTLTPSELKSIRVIATFNGNQQNAELSYLDSPCIDSYKVYTFVSSIGDVNFKAVVEKNDYKSEEASVLIGVEKPILIIDTSKTPSMANLGEEVKFVIEVKNTEGEYVDADSIKVNVINPKATYNKDISNSVVRTSKGTYTFYYKLDETDKWSFDIVVEKSGYGKYSFRHLVSVSGIKQETGTNTLNTILLLAVGILTIFLIISVVKR
jgi:hypothetical protein